MINEQKNLKEKNSFLQFIGKRSTIHGFALISSAFILTSSVFYIAAYSEPEAKNEKGEYVCKDAEVWNQKLICRISSSKLLQQVQNFSVVFAAFLFILDTFERKKRAYREAWSLIDGARESETSGARILALKELHEDQVSLKGLDAQNADLLGINLRHANLEKANLKNALLKGSNLEFADLQEAKLQKAQLQEVNLQHAKLNNAQLQGAELQNAEMQGADLRGARLQHADLRNAKLQGVMLRSAILQGADLGEAELQKANLHGVDFRGANLWRVKFDEAEITEANFAGAKNLDINQVMQAPNWKDAIYGKDFAPEYGSLLRREDFSDNNKQEEIESTATNTDFHNLVKLFIVTDSIRRKETLRLENKLNKAIELLSGEKSVSIEESDEVESIAKELVEELLQPKFNYSEVSKNQLRQHSQKITELSEEAKNEATQRKEFNILASEWLKIRCNNLKDFGIRKLLNNQPELKQPGKNLDTDIKQNYLDEDIKYLLAILAESLATQKEPPLIEEFNLKSSSSLCLNVLKIIWEDIISMMTKSEGEALSDGALKQLKGYLFLLRDELKQK